VKRGDLYWANLPRPMGRRPVLLIARNAAYAVRDQFAIALVTTRLRGVKSEVRLGPADGLPRPCAANLDAIHTIPKVTLDQFIGALGPEKLRSVDAAICFALGVGD